MENRILGRTGLSVSPICIGAWQLAGPLAFGGQPDGHPDPGKENVLRLIRAIGDMGVNCIDTAEQYGNGESERRVGEALQGQRERWIVSTKFGYRVGPDGRREDDSSPPTILRSLEGSLKRLRTDYIDIYLYHCAPKPEDLIEGHAVLERARSQGKVRFYGISTGKAELVRAMMLENMVDVLQYPANLLDTADALRELAAANSAGTQVRGVMAQGRLSGRYFSTTPSWRTDDNRQRLFPGHDYTRYAVLRDALPSGYSMADAAIRWVLDDPRNHTICMGAKSVEDYRSAIRAAALPPMPETFRTRLVTLAQSLA
jgi:aryl-alcohol dehydrogenase-like predicted oxidoreductase